MSTRCFISETFSLGGVYCKVIGLMVLCGFSCTAQVSVLTAQGSNDRSSANLHETLLTPTLVSSQGFGKLGTFSVDGQVYSHALYVAG
jgi:hypothetical protein